MRKALMNRILWFHLRWNDRIRFSVPDRPGVLDGPFIVGRRLGGRWHHRVRFTRAFRLGPP